MPHLYTYPSKARSVDLIFSPRFNKTNASFGFTLNTTSAFPSSASNTNFGLYTESCGLHYNSH